MNKTIKMFNFKDADTKDDLISMVRSFVLSEDFYTSEEHALITEALWRQARFTWLSTEDRIEVSNVLINTYIERFKEKPPYQTLHFLSSFLLYFSLEGNRDVHKVSNEDYPILTSNQLARRRGTKGMQKDRDGNYRKEVGLGAVATLGSDGIMYNDMSQERQRKRVYESNITLGPVEVGNVYVYKVEDM